MKFFQWMIYFIILNGVLTMFYTIGLFSQAAALGVPQTEWAVSDVKTFIALTGFSGIATLGLGTLTMILAVKGGVNPFVAMAYGVLTGLFLNTWFKVFAITTNIRNWLQANGAGTGASGFDIMMVLMGFIVAILFIYGLVQASIGGAKSFE